MSNPIRYDSLLVQHLARGLRERLGGRACRSTPVRLDEHSAALPLDRGEALAFNLHPSRGWIQLIRWSEGADHLLDLEVVGADAPPDERRLVIELQGGSRFRALQRRLVVELHTNHWNVLTLDGEGRIVFVLRPREIHGRALRPGEPYTPPAPSPRLAPGSMDAGALRQEWDRVLATTPEADRVGAVQRRFAYLGPINTAAILGDAAAGDTPAEWSAAFDRWLALVARRRPEPAVLHLPRGPQPYPFPLPGIESDPAPDLLTAMARVADRSSAEPVPQDRTPARVTRVVRRLEAVRQRIRRLDEQREQIGDAQGARHFGDLLLAHLTRVPRGADRVVMAGWEGEPVEIPLDPALSPADNAARWYDTARRHERAGAQIPRLMEAAEREAARWESVLAALQAGSLDDDALQEVDEMTAASRGAVPADEAVRLPFRIFRTSGGLEVRVGRGSADNDRLTFAHSRPEDVWLHARSVPGSHVILRWGSAEHAPPGRDLTEAAGLAAWFSKARTSGLVAVDWTRRKHVRKPRGAPPGQVIPQRVRTVFVEPDQGLTERLGAAAESHFDAPRREPPEEP